MVKAKRRSFGFCAIHCFGSSKGKKRRSLVQVFEDQGMEPICMETISMEPIYMETISMETISMEPICMETISMELWY